MKIELNTSVEDIRSSFKCSIEHYSIADFKDAIKREEAGSNRKSGITLLRQALRRKYPHTSAGIYLFNKNHNK